MGLGFRGLLPAPWKTNEKKTEHEMDTGFVVVCRV